MNRFFSIFFGLLVIIGLSACSNNNKNMIINDEIIEYNEVEMPAQKSEEELIWEDAQKEDVFNERITIKGNVTILETEERVSGDKVIESKTVEKEVPYFDLNVMDLRTKKDNRFAKKFLELLDKVIDP